MVLSSAPGEEPDPSYYNRIAQGIDIGCKVRISQSDPFLSLAFTSFASVLDFRYVRNRPFLGPVLQHHFNCERTATNKTQVSNLWIHEEHHFRTRRVAFDPESHFNEESVFSGTTKRNSN